MKEVDEVFQSVVRAHARSWFEKRGLTAPALMALHEDHAVLPTWEALGIEYGDGIKAEFLGYLLHKYNIDKTVNDKGRRTTKTDPDGVGVVIIDPEEIVSLIYLEHL